VSDTELLEELINSGKSRAVEFDKAAPLYATWERMVRRGLLETRQKGLSRFARSVAREKATRR